MPATSSMADWVRLPTILWVEASIASAPSAIGEGGRRAWKPKWGPHEQSTISAAPAACATSAQPSTSAAMP